MEIVFSRFIFTIYDIGIERVTRGTGGYKGLQGATGDYKGLQRVTGGDKALQGDIETFSWSILHKNQS